MERQKLEREIIIIIIIIIIHSKIVLNYDLFGHFGLICFSFMHIKKDEENKDEHL